MNNKIFKKFLATALALSLWLPQGLALGAYAADARPAPAGLGSLAVVDDEVQLGLTAPVKYNSFMTANPPRLVVELLDAEFQLAEKSVAGKGKYLLRVRSGQFERSPRMIARIVMDLSQPVKYKISPVKTGLVVSLYGGEGAPPAPVEAAAAAPAEENASAEEPEAPAAPVAPPAKKKITVAAKAPQAQEPSAAPAADAQAVDTAAELKAMAEQRDTVKKAEAPAAEPEEKSAAPKPAAPRRPRGDILSRLSRDLVSMDFENTDIRDILKLLAAKSKVNIISGSDVSGTLTLHLANVPFNEAFRTIMTMLGLSTIEVGDNILRIITPAALAKERANQVGVTKVVALNYADSAKIIAAITAVSAAEGRKTSVLADANTNSLVITDTQEGIAAAERLIAQLDIRPRQVLIEAKLVEVSLGKNFAIGIQWGFFEGDRGRILGKQGVSTIGGQAVPTVTSVVGSQPYDQNIIAAPGIAAVGSGVPGTGVSLAADSIFGALTLGRVTNNYVLNAALTAAASQRKLKVLSDPKIATMNNKPATINVTTSIPYTTANVSATGAQTVTVSYAVTGIQLAVTPTINADGTITLDVKPNVTQRSATEASTVGGAPPTDTRSVTTVVIVRDGETIVIGGLISDRLENTTAKIPLLGDIPILGWLFKKKTINRTRNELLIFVTPRILD